MTASSKTPAREAPAEDAGVVTVEYVSAGQTKGTFKFVPVDEEGPIAGTLYARKSGSASDLGDSKKLTLTIQAA